MLVKKAARRSGVSHAALLRPWGKGLIDPADLLRGERARLRRRDGWLGSRVSRTELGKALLSSPRRRTRGMGRSRVAVGEVAPSS